VNECIDRQPGDYDQGQPGAQPPPQTSAVNLAIAAHYDITAIRVALSTRSLKM